MRCVWSLAVFALAGALLSSPAAAGLLIVVDKTSQRLTVEMDSQQIFDWPVSTGTRGNDTPSGSYKPFRMEADHFSKEWDDAPMPHSIFFTMQGHAIHGTTHLKAIGQPASHGCVRLAPENAETLFKLVKQEKMANTRIVLTGTTPARPAPPVAAAPAERKQQALPDNRTLPPGDDFTGALPNNRREAMREPYREEGWGSQGGDLGRPNRGYAQPYRPYRGEVFYDRNGRAYVYERRGNSYYAQPYDQPRRYRDTPWGWN